MPVGDSIGGPVAISYEDAKWWHVGQFDHVFVTDASQGGCANVATSETAAEMPDDSPAHAAVPP